jgi:hypothetical protein
MVPLYRYPSAVAAVFVGLSLPSFLLQLLHHDVDQSERPLGLPLVVALY